jgi:GNAT superfamily N-acetyltransferase
VTVRPGAGQPAPATEYFEPARSYFSSWALFVAVLAGMAVDLGLGGAAVHLFAWLGAAVIVVGFDAFTVHTARRLRSVSVTGEEISVGAQSVARADVMAVQREVDPAAPVLGQRLHEGLPRGTVGVSVLLRDGTVRTIPTRRPARLQAALGLEQAGVVTEVRGAGRADYEALAEIDRRAETLFRVSGIDLPPGSFPADSLHEARAVLVAGMPIAGYVRIDEVDGLVHLWGPAVVPGSMRQGIGSELVEAACRWALAHGFAAVTVSTYADVPWNAPFFRRRGFVDITELTPELAERRDWEQAVGLDRVGPRVVLRRDLSGTAR